MTHGPHHASGKASNKHLSRPQQFVRRQVCLCYSTPLTLQSNYTSFDLITFFQDLVEDEITHAQRGQPRHPTAMDTFHATSFVTRSVQDGDVGTGSGFGRAVLIVAGVSALMAILLTLVYAPKHPTTTPPTANPQMYTDPPSCKPKTTANPSSNATSSASS